MPLSQFRLPDLGEGLEEAQLVQWLVRPGETVALNQPLCQVETAKALVDVPSPYAGVVKTLHAQPGETVPVGAPLVTIETSDSGATSAAPTDASAGQGPVLVGYGTEGPAQTFTRRRRGAEANAAPASFPNPSRPLQQRPPPRRMAPTQRPAHSCARSRRSAASTSRRSPALAPVGASASKTWTQFQRRRQSLLRRSPTMRSASAPWACARPSPPR